ncbi:MAG: hypothetical protein H0X17_02910 [Deltaproteobacteria bacterium]|nr:hypothetical protein [Deltaproteobacteria bacterium]
MLPIDETLTPEIAAALRVVIVFDRAIAAELEELTRDAHVWVIESPSNSPAVRGHWVACISHDQGTRVTEFGDSPEPDEAQCLDLLDVVEEHHSEHSEAGAWRELEVIGVPLNDTIRNALVARGATRQHATPRGFVAVRE